MNGVAALCRLEDTAMAMIKGTGLVFSFLQISSATGAIISTVATLSTKAEITPANNAMEMAAHWTLGTFSMIRSANSSGILLSMNSATIPIVPAIIKITLKSMVPKTLAGGSMPERIKINPDFYEFFLPRSKFTYFSLMEFVSLKTMYSKRLFIMLKQFRTTGYRRIEE